MNSLHWMPKKILKNAFVSKSARNPPLTSIIHKKISPRDHQWPFYHHKVHKISYLMISKLALGYLIPGLTLTCLYYSWCNDFCNNNAYVLGCSSIILSVLNSYGYFLFILVLYLLYLKSNLCALSARNFLQHQCCWFQGFFKSSFHVLKLLS